MLWEDENYVKLYTRDTPTWKALRWEAKATLALLLRKLDKAGLLECGRLGRAAVGLMVDVPEHVVMAGLEDLERHEVIAWHGNTLEMPNYEEAQEARKSDVLRKREQRQKAKDRARASASKNAETIPQTETSDTEPAQPIENRDDDVTRGHTASQDVTRRHSPDTPDTPDTPDNKASAGKKARLRSPKPTDPRFPGLKTMLLRVFLEIRGAEYDFGIAPAADSRAINKLVGHDVGEVEKRWRRGLNWPAGYLRASGIAKFVKDWQSYAEDPNVVSFRKPSDIRKSPVRAEDIKHSAAVGDVTHDF